jgi:hypothetical protein
MGAHSLYIEPGERNLLLNPAHLDYARADLALERDPFVFDPMYFRATQGIA